MPNRPIAHKGAVLLDGTIDVPAERLAAVSAALPEHVRLTREEAGCLHFSVTGNADTPGRFDVSEVFIDQAAFDAHQARAGASDWAEVTRAIARNYRIRVA
jgi:quinol monooxygenase YgiN